MSNCLRPLDCSPSFSVHGIIQARIQECVAMPSSRGIFPTQGLNPHLLRLLHCWWILYHWATREAPVKSMNLLKRIQSEKENSVHNIHLYFQNMFLYIIVAILYIGEGNGTPLQHSCLEIPWMEEPGGLQSMGSLRVGHDWATSLSLFTCFIGEGNGNPLQCSCLENPRDGGAWWAAVYGVAQSRTRLKRLSSILYIFRKYMKECT